MGQTCHSVFQTCEKFHFRRKPKWLLSFRTTTLLLTELSCCYSTPYNFTPWWKFNIIPDSKMCNIQVHALSSWCTKPRSNYIGYIRHCSVFKPIYKLLCQNTFKLVDEIPIVILGVVLPYVFIVSPTSQMQEKHAHPLYSILNMLWLNTKRYLESILLNPHTTKS